MPLQSENYVQSEISKCYKTRKPKSTRTRRWSGRLSNAKRWATYHDLYVKTDVALLEDLFENFRNLCQEQYGLDSAHFYTSPGVSWDALLKKDGD